LGLVTCEQENLELQCILHSAFKTEWYSCDFKEKQASLNTLKSCFFLFPLLTFDHHFLSIIKMEETNMRAKLTVLVIILGLALMLATSASAQKLLCVSKQNLKGEQTVNSCLAQGDRFAVVDKYGLVRILTPEEVALTKALNPKVFQTRAFGMKYIRLAPPLPPLPIPSYVPGG
jgi:hypothetical protein